VALKDEIDRAKARADMRAHLEAHIRNMPVEDARTMLLDMLVALPAPVDERSRDEARLRERIQHEEARFQQDLQHLRENETRLRHGYLPAMSDSVVVPHGARMERTYQFLYKSGGATVEQVARAIYGGDDAEARKRASSILSLLKSPQGGECVTKDETTQVWTAVERGRLMTTR
jgi:hypothetical protein